MKTVKLDMSALDDVIKLEEEVYETLPDKNFLRHNSPMVLAECLREPHLALGVYDGRTLVCLSVMWMPEGDERLNIYLRDPSLHALRAANYKLCIVSPDARGRGLQRSTGEELIGHACEHGIELLCATAYSANIYSIRNLGALGFECDGEIQKYGMSRLLFYRRLSD